MDFKGKTNTEQLEELTGAIFAEFLFGPDNFSLQLCDQADSSDVVISGLIRAQVVRAGSGEHYHRNRAQNAKTPEQPDVRKAAAKKADIPPAALTEVSPVYQVCHAIEHKIRDKNYSDADKLVLLILCEMPAEAFSQVEKYRHKITQCTNSHFPGKKIFREIWAVHRSQDPIRVVKLYP